MATTLNRGSTWTNPDGLIVGFGQNLPVKEGSVQRVAGSGVKQASVTFTYDNMSSANIPIPAGATVIAVNLDVHVAWVGGTDLQVGDGSDADGFVTAAQGATANLTAGAHIVGAGLYTKGATDTTAQELKVYAAADTLDIAATGTFTAGSATVTMIYV